MALAFVFALFVQRVPRVGDELDAVTLLRMREREAYLSEKMTQLLLEIEEKNMEQSRTGLQALLFAALPYWKICSALCLFVLLFWVMWKIQKKFWGVEDSSDKESSSREEQQEHKEVKEEEVSLFLADVLRPLESYEGRCKEMLSLLDLLVKISQNIVSDTFFPMPERPIGVGSAYEGWGPTEAEPDFCLLVPLTAPRGHVFHLELGTAGELPARNSRIRVELECTCGREQEMGMLCFLHASEDELKNQDPSLLHSLCTGFYLDMEKTAHWFLLLIEHAQKCMPQSATWNINVTLSGRCCKLHLRDFYGITVCVKIAFGIQQDNTDIFLSNYETQPASIASTAWPQSCAVAEVKFFQHIAAHSQGGNFCHRYLQVCARTLVGQTFPTYIVKTVLMNLLTAIPLEGWDKRHFLLRMDDILHYLRCCVEEKRLDHFFIGTEELPSEIILPQDFQVSQPLNLFQHLAQDLEKHEKVLHELEQLQDQCRSLLIFGWWETSTFPTAEHARHGEDAAQ